MTKSTYVLVAAIAALSVLHVASFGFCLQDDTYIGLRYSRNFSSGEGFVYNSGERVEGYTNFLWIVIGTVPFLLEINPIVYIRIVGILTAILATIASGKLAFVVSGKSRFAFVFGSFIFACIPFAMGEAAMGLETLLFLFFVLYAFSSYIAEIQDSGRGGSCSGVLLALAYLTRPEGLAVALLLATVDLLRWLRMENQKWMGRQLFERWSVFGLIAVSHIIFRLVYYNDIVPNTYHAKVGGGISSLGRGIRYLKQYISDAILLIVAAVFSIILLLKKGRELQRKVAFIAILFLVVNLSYVVYIGGDFKPTHRFFVLPSGIMAGIAGAGLSYALTLFKRKSVQVFIIAFLILTAAQLYLSGSGVRQFASWRRSVLPVHIEAGRWLAANYPDSTLIATGNAGVIPFESGLPCIDMHGLCDRQIALRPIAEMGMGLPGHEKGDGLYVLSRRPDIILFMKMRFTDYPATESDMAGNLFGLSEFEIWGNPLFHQNYHLKTAQLESKYFNYYEIL